MSGNCQSAPLEDAQWVVSQTLESKDKHSQGQMQKKDKRKNINIILALQRLWDSESSMWVPLAQRHYSSSCVSLAHLDNRGASPSLPCWDWDVPVTEKFSFGTEITQNVCERAGTWAQILLKYLSLGVHFPKLLMYFVPVLGPPPSILPAPHLYETHISHQTSCSSQMSRCLHQL